MLMTTIWVSGSIFMDGLKPLGASAFPCFAWGADGERTSFEDTSEGLSTRGAGGDVGLTFGVVMPIGGPFGAMDVDIGFLQKNGILLIPFVL